MTNTNTFSPNYIVHPGEIVSERLAFIPMTAAELSVVTGIPYSILLVWLWGAIVFSDKMLVRIAGAIEYDPATLINMQKAWVAHRYGAPHKPGSNEVCV